MFYSSFFRGEYVDSKLKGPVKPCAGNVGTQITVGPCYSQNATIEYSSESVCVSLFLRDNSKSN